MVSFARKVILGALLTIVVAVVAQAQPQPPKRVLLLHSWGPEFGDLYATDMRAQLSQQLPAGCELYEEWLASARFTSGEADAAFAVYLDTVFKARPPDLVITLGAPAANFVQSHGQTLFQGIPKLMADVEERRVPGAGLAPDETTVSISVNFPTVVQNILRVRPKTRTVAVVIGNSPIERYWVGQLRDSLEPFKDRISLAFLTDLPFSAVLRRVATLPADSAILYVLLSPEVEGIPPVEDTALAQLHAAANAPMFSYTDAYLGKGILGGPLVSGQEQGRATAQAAVRLMAGESAADVRIAPRGFGQPVFDWREMQRWNIEESDLPAGSRIVFREPTVWQRYHWEIALLLGVLAVMAALIVRLLYEHRRWRRSERDARQRMSELSHMNRRTTVGELSASITHELTQPLYAIGNNAKVVEVQLASASPDLSELREIASDITRDQRRAVEVIKRLRGLFTKSGAEPQILDLGEVVREVFALLSSHAFAHRTTLHTTVPHEAVCVKGDRVQLQQVILNVVMNGIDAIEGANSSRCEITGVLSVAGSSAEVSIEDTGPGLSKDHLEKMFDPFFTTKSAGMGMGLALARRIIVSHGGRIWAENGLAGGAVLRFVLPLQET